MDDTIDKKEKVTSTNRRNNKPLMEKRRRQRINECLNQLKTLVLQALNKDSTQYSKLEKADILEMTVKHLKLVQRQQMTAAMATDPNVISKYRAGFNECAAEISRYLDTVNGGSPELKGRVLNYLSNSITQFPVIPVYQGVVPPYHLQMTSPMTSQHGFIPQYSQGAVMSNTNSNSAFVSQDYLQRSQHSSLESTQKTEQLRIPLHSDSLSHRTSPPRRVPSPCDSDSGLSDSSTSMSHDENGNYSHFNINHNSSVPTIKSEHDDSNFSKYLRNESDYTHALRKPTSPQKRSHTFPDGHTSPKRHRPCDNFNQSEPVNMAVRQVAATESIWRPF